MAQPHPRYKLIYFNGRGRAERARLMFAYTGVDYEDVRVEEDEWAAHLKQKMPFGQLPVLDIDNGKVMLAQSKSICRYLGKQLGLVPEDNLETAKADMLVDGLDDLIAKLTPWFREKDTSKKDEMWKDLEAEELIPFLNRYEKFLAESGTDYFVNNTITWADFTLFNYLQSTQEKRPHLLEARPKLTKFISKVANEPKVKAWIEKRPLSDY